MQPAEYWRKRAQDAIDQGMAGAEDVLRKLQRAYSAAQREVEAEVRRLVERYGKDYRLSYADAVKDLRTSEYKQWRMRLDEYVERINATGDAELLRELDLLSTRSRVERLTQVQTAIRTNMAELASQGEARVRQLLDGAYRDSYYQGAYAVQQGMGVYASLEMISGQAVAQALAYPWSGASFSQRIWENTRRLGLALEQSVTQGLIQGKDVRQMAKSIQAATGAAYANAQRLVRTETARVVEEATMAGYQTSGVEQIKILVAEDERTCKTCGARDGAVVSVDEAVMGGNVPPFHPNCRCTTTPYFSQEQLERWEKIGAAYQEHGAELTDLSYEEWKAKYVTGEGKHGIIDSSPFTPAKTIKDANAYAMKELGIPNVSYKGCDVRTANEWNKGLKDTFAQFPELKENFQFAGECHERNALVKQDVERYWWEWYREWNAAASDEALRPYVDAQVRKDMKKLAVSKHTYAQSWLPTKDPYRKGRGITVNRGFGRDYEAFTASLAQDVERQFHPVGCDTVRSVLDHEIGHQIDGLLGLNADREIRQLFDERSRAELTDQLSRYAWDNDSQDRYAEFIAEAWAEWCNNPNPRPLAKQVAEIIARRQREWRRKNS